MDVKKLTVLILAAFFLFGCGTAYKMNRIELGMTQQEVEDAMGEPDSTSAAEDFIYLRYTFWTEGFFLEDYFVQLRNDRVEAYGRVGDFGRGY